MKRALLAGMVVWSVCAGVVGAASYGIMEMGDFYHGAITNHG